MHQGFTRYIQHILNHLLDPVLGHTRVVMGTKTMVFSVAIILALVTLLLPLFYNKGQEYINAGYQHIAKRITTPAMMNPRFHGIDNHHQPYHIVADTAIKAQDNQLVLTNVTADISLSDTQYITAKATQAIYALPTRDIQLFGIIHVTSTTGYEATTSVMILDLKNSKASGNNSIHIKGPLGTLTAGSFEMPDTHHLIFENHVTMKLNPKKAKHPPFSQ